MSKLKLKHYTGPLTPEQVAAGMNAAQRNAKNLVHDAQYLLQAGRYPRAASLAALAIEEAGKVSILREIAVARDRQELEENWRRYRSHTQKNVEWLLPQLVVQGARKLEDFRALFDPGSDHPQLLDSIKQLGFYTDCLGDAHWSEPDSVIDEKLARKLVEIAAILTKGREITPREIELWIQHIKPVWKGPMEWMKKALANWQADIAREGLTNEPAEDMVRFLSGTEREGAEDSDSRSEV